MGLDAPTRRAVDVITHDAVMNAVADLEADIAGKTAELAIHESRDVHARFSGRVRRDGLSPRGLIDEGGAHPDSPVSGLARVHWRQWQRGSQTTGRMLAVASLGVCRPAARSVCE